MQSTNVDGSGPGPSTAAPLRSPSQEPQQPSKRIVKPNSKYGYIPVSIPTTRTTTTNSSIADPPPQKKIRMMQLEVKKEVIEPDEVDPLSFPASKRERGRPKKEQAVDLHEEDSEDDQADDEPQIEPVYRKPGNIILHTYRPLCKSFRTPLLPDVILKSNLPGRLPPYLSVDVHSPSPDLPDTYPDPLDPLPSLFHLLESLPLFLHVLVPVHLHIYPPTLSHRALDIQIVAPPLPAFPPLLNLRYPEELPTATVIDRHPVQHQLLLSLLKRHLDGQQDQEQEPAKKKSDGAQVQVPAEEAQDHLQELPLDGLDQNDPAGHEDDDAQNDGGEPERNGIIDATEIYVHHEEVVYAEDDQDDVVDSEPEPSDEERHDEEDAPEEKEEEA